MEDDAASALLDMASPPGLSSPQRTTKTVLTTPPRTLKLTRVKRSSEHILDITYETPEGKSCEIPFAAHEEDFAFVKRRVRACHALYDPARADVYCTWSGKVVNIPILDSRFSHFHETIQQKRYSFQQVLQLVVSRHTCLQWGSLEPCRSCHNRGFRAGCQKPTFLYFLMPMPGFRNHKDVCDAVLGTLEPLSIPDDVSVWSDRIPQNYVR